MRLENYFFIAFFSSGYIFSYLLNNLIREIEKKTYIHGYKEGTFLALEIIRANGRFKK